jgi:hypothetical protein
VYAYCRYTFYDGDNHVSKKTCSEGGFGTCVPLWSDYLGAPGSGDSDYSKILSQLFLKSYGSYTLSGESYSLGALSFSNITIPAGQPPTISGVKFNGSDSLTAGSAINVSSKNLYRLEFNTTINKDQQPLREIYIEWGDGTAQVIKGQDNRPNPSSPHIFYHYYNTTGKMKLKIEVKDNWDKPATWSAAQ